MSLLKQRLGSMPKIYTSSSQQFIVVGYEPGSPNGPPDRAMIRSNHVQLDPAVLVATCERVRSHLLLLLRRQEDKWEAPITIRIIGRGDPDMPIGVAGGLGARGWRFTLTVPGQVKRTRLVRAIVRGILLDVANRGNMTRKVAEIPLWLQEGIAARLSALWGYSLASGINHQLYGLDGPKMVVNRAPTSVFDQTYRDLLGPERRHLDLFDPVGFTDLQHPLPGHLEGYHWRTFQACSHVFVAQLLKMKDGEKMLWGMIGALSEYSNAQFAFLDSFKSVFATALAADQWWSLVLVDFKTRDPTMRWGEQRSLARLQEILQAPVTIRRSTNTVPVMKEMMFQDLLRETPYRQHRPIIAQSIAKLVIMRFNAQEDLARLIHDYRGTLENYLRRQDGKIDSSAAKLLKRETIEKLNLLDGIRFDMKLVASPEPEKPLDLNRVEKLIDQAAAQRGVRVIQQK